MDPFREFLTGWLARNGWSASRLARESGVPQNVISRWTGRYPTKPSTKNLKKLAPTLGVPYEDLLRLCGYLDAETADAATDDGVDAELRQRLVRLEGMLSRYPRPFWSAVIDASERMADAAEGLIIPFPSPPLEREVKPVPSSRIKPRTRPFPDDGSGSDGSLTVPYPRESVAA